MRVAVLQSNYIPWKGYFDLIHDVDLFVFYDDVQYTKNDWRNRNKVKTPTGTQWITIPTGCDLDRRICDVQLPAGNWQTKHWKTLEQNYHNAPHWKTYGPAIRSLYCAAWSGLSELNQRLIRELCQWMGIRTVLMDSRYFSPEGSRQDRLLMLLKACGATHYVSGPSGKNYIDPQAFEDAGITLEWKRYDYPEYPQFFPPFDHRVSVLDLIFHTGPEAPRYVWG